MKVRDTPTVKLPRVLDSYAVFVRAANMNRYAFPQWSSAASVDFSNRYNSIFTTYDGDG